MRSSLLASGALALLFGTCLFGCSAHPTGPAMGTVVLRLTDAPADFDAIHVVVTEVSIHRGGSSGDDDDSLGVEVDDDSLEVGESNDDSLEVGDHDDSLEVGESDDGRGEEQGGWEVLSHEARTYDLLALRNGVFAILGVGDVPAGHYTQIRLKIGVGSDVVVGGVSHPLVIPSGMQSGLKLVGGFRVPAGGEKDLTLDFDGARSVVPEPDGTYRLRPTIRVIGR